MANAQLYVPLILRLPTPDGKPIIELFLLYVPLILRCPTPLKLKLSDLQPLYVPLFLRCPTPPSVETPQIQFSRNFVSDKNPHIEGKQLPRFIFLLLTIDTYTSLFERGVWYHAGRFLLSDIMPPRDRQLSDTMSKTYICMILRVETSLASRVSDHPDYWFSPHAMARVVKDRLWFTWQRYHLLYSLPNFSVTFFQKNLLFRDSRFFRQNIWWEQPNSIPL